MGVAADGDGDARAGAFAQESLLRVILAHIRQNQAPGVDFDTDFTGGERLCGFPVDTLCLGRFAQIQMGQGFLDEIGVSDIIEKTATGGFPKSGEILAV